MLWLPHSFFLCILLCITAYVYEPRFKTVPISIVEEPSPLAMTLWIVEEFWYLSMVVAICVLGATTHALRLERFLTEIKSIRVRATSSR